MLAGIVGKSRPACCNPVGASIARPSPGGKPDPRASTARPYTPAPRGRCRREIVHAPRGRYRWKIPPRLLHPCRGEHRSPVPLAAGALRGRALLAPTTPVRTGGNGGEYVPPGVVIPYIKCRRSIWRGCWQCIARFPDNRRDHGRCDHGRISAKWSVPAAW